MPALHVPILMEESVYVENMDTHNNLDTTREFLFEIVNAPSTGNSNLMDAVTLATDGMETVDVDADEGFGRTVKVTSTNAGDLVLFGRDYLGQYITERVTCTVGTVETEKAFKNVYQLQSESVDGDVSLGYGTKFGLPFVIDIIVKQLTDGASSATPSFTGEDADAATSDTGDTRGTVAPTNAPNGERTHTFTCVGNPFATGGLYGVPAA